MASQGDDCYFYFYSTCSKGDDCPFRHCEAAVGSETVCTLWQERRCSRKVCKFRHMEIDKKRSEIPCYWESQPTGCQKVNCAFHHSKARFVDGVYLPPSKNTYFVNPRQDMPAPRPKNIQHVNTDALPVTDGIEEEKKLPQISAQPILANPSPQLRGVIKVENSESVPSPTHPPVVINAADDDEDDDDQFSEEGEDNKIDPQQLHLNKHNGVRIISTRKPSTPKKEKSLDLGIKTLEEIRLRKIKEKQKKEDSSGPLQLTKEKGASGIEKENLRTVIRTVTLPVRKGEVDLRSRRSLSERLGKRKVSSHGNPVETAKNVTFSDTEPPLKRSLAERLGRKIDPLEDSPRESPVKGKVARTIRERLGLPAEQMDTEAVQVTKPIRERLSLPTVKMDTDTAQQTKPAGEIRIKTLEEIRREKSARQQGEILVQIKNETALGTSDSERPSKIILSRGTADPEKPSKSTSSSTQTFSEILKAKKRKQLEVHSQNMSPSKKKAKLEEEEEEKESQESNSAESKPPMGPAGKFAKKSKPLEQVRVKTLEEIRQEKALKKQQTPAQDTSSAPQSEPAIAQRRLIRVVKLVPTTEEKKQGQPAALDEGTVAGSAVAKPLSKKEHVPTEKVQVKSFDEIMREKRLRKQQEAEQQHCEKVQKEPLVEVPVEEKKTAEKQSPAVMQKELLAQVSPQVQKTAERSQTMRRTQRMSSVVQKANENPAADKPPEQFLLAAKEPAAESGTAKPTPEKRKRPKVNVKPSVVKTTPAVRLAQKRKALDAHPSAIATVKPMNSSREGSTEEEPVAKKTTHTAPSSAPEDRVVARPADVLEKSQESIQPPLQTQPVTTSPIETVSPTPSRVAAKTRRLSAISVSKQPDTSMDDDDFEALIQEFSTDNLEAEIELEPGKDEDDLLLELSEMIDS